MKIIQSFLLSLAFLALIGLHQCVVYNNNSSSHSRTSPVTPDTIEDDKIPILKGNITDKSNVTCLRFEFGIVLRLNYFNSTTNKTNCQEEYLPADAHLESDNCDNNSNNTESFWFKFGKNESFKLIFEQNESSVYLASIQGEIKLWNGTMTYINVTRPNKNFNVDKSHSYFCAQNVSVSIDDKSEVIFSKMHIQAFMPPDQKGAFSDEHNCQNEINDVVPIAVGAALTALVIIVMIAYFIGRRRSRRLAYQSV